MNKSTYNNIQYIPFGLYCHGELIPGVITKIQGNSRYEIKMVNNRATKMSKIWLSEKSAYLQFNIFKPATKLCEK